MKNNRINYHLERAAHFRALSDPEHNHELATAHSVMLPEKARRRAIYHEQKAADYLAEGLAEIAARKAGKKRVYKKHAKP